MRSGGREETMRARTRRPGPDDAGGHRKPASEPSGTAASEPAGTAPSEPAGTAASEPGGMAPSEPGGMAPSEPAGTAIGKPGGGRAANSYRELLRLPGALAFSASGFLARMPMSMFSLGTVLHQAPGQGSAVAGQAPGCDGQAQGRSGVPDASPQPGTDSTPADAEPAPRRAPGPWWPA